MGRWYPYIKHALWGYLGMVCYSSRKVVRCFDRMGTFFQKIFIFALRMPSSPQRESPVSHCRKDGGFFIWICGL